MPRATKKKSATKKKPARKKKKASRLARSFAIVMPGLSVERLRRMVNEDGYNDFPSSANDAAEKELRRVTENGKVPIELDEVEDAFKEVTGFESDDPYNW